MTLLISFSILCLAALIHASFQLSVSTFTLMSGHALGRRQSQHRLVSLIGGFVLGAAVMTTLLLSTLSFVIFKLLGSSAPPVVWAAVCGLLFGIGVAVWLFYYRRTRGTVLWIPRRTADYLAKRSKKTTNSGEAFGLGLASVFGELLFVLGPLLASALVIFTMPTELQLLAVALYVGISLLSLLLVAALVGSGHKLSDIQKWREANKQFLQFAAGSGLLVLGFYLYVNEVLALPFVNGGMV